MSARYGTVLAAVDASPRAPGVVRAAADLAERHGATLHLFRAVPLAPEMPPAAPSAPDALETSIAAHTRQELAALAAGLSGVIIDEPRLVSTAPWRAILEVAAAVGADVIVVGSHGFGGWDRVLGTTAASIADRADRDVLIVHERRPG